MDNDQIQTGDDEVEKIMAEINQPEAGREMGNESPTPEPAAPVWNGAEWEFETGGKKVFPDSREKALTWMSQGHNYSQRMGELNKTHAQRMADANAAHMKAQEIEKRFSPYSKIDEYAAKNPEWWQFVEKSWNERETPQLDPNLQKIIAPLQQELGTIKDFVGTLQQREEQEKIKAQDQALDQEIESTRKQYPNIDFDAVDPETRETLIQRIYKHANENQIGTFKAAMRDLLHDRLIEDAKANGRTAEVKGKEKLVKAGILGTTQAPTKELKPVNTRVPWNDQSLSSENILKEMGL